MASRASRDRILSAAERLIAERGVDVPLRDIRVAAGQRNNSAVHYHFGGREGLIQAVLDRRTAPQEARRLEILAELERTGRADDLRALVDALFRPNCEIPYAAGATHYARFLAQLRNHPTVSDMAFDPARYPAAQIMVNRIARHLAHLPAPARARRLQAMATVEFVLLADHERRWDGKGSPAPTSEEIDDLVNMTVALLLAPATTKVSG